MTEVLQHNRADGRDYVGTAADLPAHRQCRLAWTQLFMFAERRGSRKGCSDCPAPAGLRTPRPLRPHPCTVAELDEAVLRAVRSFFRGA